MRVWARGAQLGVGRSPTDNVIKGYPPNDNIRGALPYTKLGVARPDPHYMAAMIHRKRFHVLRPNQDCAAFMQRMRGESARLLKKKLHNRHLEVQSPWCGAVPGRMRQVRTCKPVPSLLTLLISMETS